MKDIALNVQAIVNCQRIDCDGLEDFLFEKIMILYEKIGEEDIEGGERF